MAHTSSLGQKYVSLSPPLRWWKAGPPDSPWPRWWPLSSSSQQDTPPVAWSCKPAHHRRTEICYLLTLTNAPNSIGFTPGDPWLVSTFLSPRWFNLRDISALTISMYFFGGKHVYAISCHVSLNFTLVLLFSHRRLSTHSPPLSFCLCILGGTEAPKRKINTNTHSKNLRIFNSRQLVSAAW